MEGEENKFFWYLRTFLAFFVFLFSLLISLYIYSKGFSWDFMVYELNAGYWFFDGNYFEPLRPPLLPLILGLLGFLFLNFAPFVYIILVSLLHFYSTYLLAYELGFSWQEFYILTFSPFFVFYGLVNGGELLFLTLFQFMIVFLLRESFFSGVFLGLASLVRYNGVLFFPFLFLQRSVKGVLFSLISFFSVLGVWLFSSFYLFGDALYGFADQYANNIVFRQDLLVFSPSQFFIDLLYLWGVFIPVFLFGFLLYLLRFAKNGFEIFWRELSEGFKFSKLLVALWDFAYRWRIFIFMFLILSLTLFQYSRIPLSHPRYAFLIFIPLVYFSYIGLWKISSLFSMRRLWFFLFSFLIFMLNLFFFSFLVSSSILFIYDDSNFSKGLLIIDELNISSCRILSNGWVPLRYNGIYAEPLGFEDFYLEDVLNGEILMIYREFSESDFFLNDSLPILYSSDEIIIYSLIGSCPEGRIYDLRYSDFIAEIIYRKQGYYIDTSSFSLLFGRGV